MKILITGSRGQLGKEIMAIIQGGEAELGEINENVRTAKVIAVDVEELDITNKKQVEDFVDKETPDIIINCAAITNVDGCESNEEIAYMVNALGPRNLAMAAEKINAKLLHISTDYVFQGIGDKPLKEYEITSPTTVYGKTKLLGENYVKEFCTRYFIVRTSWLYGYEGNNFVYTMLKLGKTKDSITVVNDQRGNPTYANDLVYHILKIIETEEYGVYHCTGKGECSWFDFAQRIMKEAMISCKVIPCTSEEYKTPAKRPSYSSLDNMMLRLTIGDNMRHWEDALNAFIEKVK